jgi:hypothetical protein
MTSLRFMYIGSYRGYMGLRLQIIDMHEVMIEYMKLAFVM